MSNPTPETFGSRLRQAKIDSGLSWREIADALGKDTRQLHVWASGSHEPRLENVRKLAEVLGVEPAQLMGEK